MRSMRERGAALGVLVHTSSYAVLTLQMLSAVAMLAVVPLALLPSSNPSGRCRA